MSGNSSKADSTGSKGANTNADAQARKSHESREGDGADASAPHDRQPDGSKVTTPPSDPANSDETLRRNRNGNS
jgi:hypothetical protein